MPIHTGTSAPVSGCVTEKPVATPFFSIVARSASAKLVRLHSSMKAAMSGRPSAKRVASGCSAAIAMNVTPMIVSARVVNTRSSFFSPSSSYGKPKLTPTLLPIQFSCIAFTCGGHSSASRSASSSSAYCVIAR